MNSGLRKKSKWGHSDRIEFWLVAKIERTLAKTEDFAGMQWILNSEFQCPSLKLWFQTLPKAQGTQGIEDFDSFNTFNIRTSPTICGALIVFSPEDCKLVWLSQIRNFLHLCVQFPLILYYQTPFSSLSINFFTEASRLGKIKCLTAKLLLKQRPKQLLKNPEKPKWQKLYDCVIRQEEWLAACLVRMIIPTLNTSVLWGRPNNYPIVNICAPSEIYIPCFKFECGFQDVVEKYFLPEMVWNGVKIGPIALLAPCPPTVL